MTKIPNVFLVGSMAAGKSTIGRWLAQYMGREFYDTDQEIEARTGVSIAWIFDLEGEQGFRRREEAVLEELTCYSDIVLATGGGVVLSPINRVALETRGYIIYLQVSIEQQLARTTRDRKRPLLQTKNPAEALLKLQQQREVLYQEIAHYQISSDGNSAQQIAQKINDHLCKHFSST